MGVNSAHPLENPNAFTNLIEMLSILLIPAALCFTFGKAVKNKKQGVAIFMAMFICLALALGTGIRSGFMPEKLVGKQFTLEHAAIDRDERPGAPPGKLVYQPGKELLSRAGFPVHENRGVGTGHLGSQTIQIAHGFGLENKFPQPLFRTEFENFDSCTRNVFRQFLAVLLFGLRFLCPDHVVL